MKKLVLLVGLVASGLYAQQGIPLPNGWLGGPTTPSACLTGSSVDFYNWTDGQLYACLGATANYTPYVQWVAVTVLPPVTAVTKGRIYRFTAATKANVCPDAGDSGGTQVATCVTYGNTHYHAVQMSAADGTANVPIGGALVIPGQVSRPTCDSGHRFWFWTVTGSSGVADTIAVCAGDNGTPQVFAWRTIY